jgi:hypothetical protein
MDIKEAAALASLFGIEPTEGFQRFVSFWMHRFAWDAIERARIGYRTRDDELWHDVLSRIAPGAAQAAAVCAAARRGELPSWHKWMVDGLLDEIGFELPRPDVHMTADDTALEITQAYQRLADHARSMLDQIGPRTRGRKHNGLDLFILMLVGIVQIDRPDVVKPAAFTEGVATALALAAHRAPRAARTVPTGSAQNEWRRGDVACPISEASVVGSTGKPRRSRCWSLACAPTARRCCWRSRAWAARALRPGGQCSTI